MAMDLTPRFEDRPAMLLVGLRRTHAYADSARGIPQQWQDFAASGLLPPGPVVSYGVMCGGDPVAQTMEYMCAVEVAGFDKAPAGAGRMRVPAQRYAVFTHEGHVSGISDAWMRIWNEWIPQSGHRIAHTPEFERYDDRFDPKTEGGVVEVWCSIVRGDAPMIDPPEIVSTDAQQTAVIRLTIPRAEIQKVMGPAIGEVLGTVAAQGLTPTGPVFSHHFAMSPETFDFEVGVPVASTIMAFGRVRAGVLPAFRAAKTVFRGSYEGMAGAWGEFEKWIAAGGHRPAADLWECYAAGPESSPDPANWRTELYRPLL